jgi:hypothetical protein
MREGREENYASDLELQKTKYLCTICVLKRSRKSYQTEFDSMIGS